GVVYLLELIADAFDFGTAYVSYLVTGIMHFVTLGWMNLEMIYGSWIAKGKSKLISPLNWSPLPLNGILPEQILWGVVILLDLVLIFIGLVILIAMMAVVYIYYQFLTDPVGTTSAILSGSGDAILTYLGPAIRTILGI